MQQDKAAYVQMLQTQLLEALCKVRENPNPEYGICYAVEEQWTPIEHNYPWRGCDWPETEDMLNELFIMWPKFSGRSSYPVPSVAKNKCPGESFDDASYNATLWTKMSAYGRLRWELLHFCIAKLQEKLNDTASNVQGNAA